jgi:hypothetical protein
MLAQIIGRVPDTVTGDVTPRSLSTERMPVHNPPPKKKRETESLETPGSGVCRPLICTTYLSNSLIYKMAFKVSLVFEIISISIIR